MTRDSRRFLQPEAIARIARLELRARRIVEGFLAGLHRSPYFGQSVEFVQHREYVPGDDIRRIDWKAWSKTDKYYIKQFEEDTNLRCCLLVDVSESMQFGAQPLNKLEYAAAIAAALSYLLLRQQDAVGLTTFDSGVRTALPVRSQRSQLNSIIAALTTCTASNKSDLYPMLRQTAESLAHRGVVVLISDLLCDVEGLSKGLRLLRRRGHDVMVLHVLDDEELDFNYNGVTKFEGLEEAGEVLCDPRSLRDGYLAALQAFLQNVRRTCAREMIDYQTIRTSTNLDAALAHFLNHRQGTSRAARA